MAIYSYKYSVFNLDGLIAESYLTDNVQVGVYFDKRVSTTTKSGILLL